MQFLIFPRFRQGGSDSDCRHLPARFFLQEASEFRGRSARKFSLVIGLGTVLSNDEDKIVFILRHALDPVVPKLRLPDPRDRKKMVRIEMAAAVLVSGQQPSFCQISVQPVLKQKYRDQDDEGGSALRDDASRHIDQDPQDRYGPSEYMGPSALFLSYVFLSAFAIAESVLPS